jgi:hypothetical protein
LAFVLITSIPFVIDFIKVINFNQFTFIFFYCSRKLCSLLDDCSWVAFCTTCWSVRDALRIDAQKRVEAKDRVWGALTQGEENGKMTSKLSLYWNCKCGFHGEGIVEPQHELRIVDARESSMNTWRVFEEYDVVEKTDLSHNDLTKYLAFVKDGHLALSLVVYLPGEKPVKRASNRIPFPMPQSIIDAQRGFFIKFERKSVDFRGFSMDAVLVRQKDQPIVLNGMIFGDVYYLGTRGNPLRSCAQLDTKCELPIEMVYLQDDLRVGGTVKFYVIPQEVNVAQNFRWIEQSLSPCAELTVVDVLENIDVSARFSGDRYDVLRKGDKVKITHNLPLALLPPTCIVFSTSEQSEPIHRFNVHKDFQRRSFTFRVPLLPSPEMVVHITWRVHKKKTILVRFERETYTVSW